MTAAPYNLILVTGAMRSGTTLLQQVLCCAPDANPFVHGCRYLTSQIEVYAAYAGPDRLYVEDYLGGPQGLFDFTQDLLERLLAATHERLGGPAHLVLKNPELARVLPQAAALLPQARFVVSLREPKDNIASMIEVGEKHRRDKVNSFLARTGRNIGRLCAAYREFYEPMLRHLDQHPDLRSRVCFVPYEALVQDTDRTVARLAEFCGITLSVEEIAGRQGWRSNVDAASDPLYGHPRWSAYVTQLSGGPISAASIERYGDVLSAEEAAKVDRLCATLSRRFGYSKA